MHDTTAVMHRTRTRFLERAHSIRPGLYSLIILGAVWVSFGYSILRDGIFACQGHGYSADRFLAECTAPGYGNYEHGAFWFGLEPAALNAAHDAQVLFLGDSRIEVGFSTAAIANWFSLASIKYYLLGFGYRENGVFIQKLLRKIEPQAKVYIINAESYFERTETPPAKYLTHDLHAGIWYRVKRMWQFAHKPFCSAAPGLCGDNYAVFRSRETGTYQVSGGRQSVEPVWYDQNVDQDIVENNAASASDSLPQLGVRRECIILTLVPHGKTKTEPEGTRIATAKAVAAKLGMNFVAPELDGLKTFDGSHLDHASAQRYSSAFLEAAGPQIRKCLDQP